MHSSSVKTIRETVDDKDDTNDIVLIGQLIAFNDAKKASQFALERRSGENEMMADV